MTVGKTYWQNFGIGMTIGVPTLKDKKGTA